MGYLSNINIRIYWSWGSKLENSWVIPNSEILKKSPETSILNDPGSLLFCIGTK